MMAHERERLQHLTCEAANEASREPMKVVRLDQFVKVNAQELHRNAQMTTEIEMLRHLDDMVLLFRILSQRHEQCCLQLTPTNHSSNVPIFADCQES